MRRRQISTITAIVLVVLVTVVPSIGRAYVMERCHVTGLLHVFQGPTGYSSDFGVKGKCITPSGASLTLSAEGRTINSPKQTLFPPAYLVDVSFTDHTTGSDSAAQEYWHLRPLEDELSRGVYYVSTQATTDGPCLSCPAGGESTGFGLLTHGPETTAGLDHYWYITLELTYGFPWNKGLI